MIKRLGSKYFTEVIPITFDFTNDLAPGELFMPGTALVEVSVDEGTDASPNLVKNGSPVMALPYVVQSVKNGNRADYLFRCSVQTDRGNTYVLQCILPVRQDV